MAGRRAGVGGSGVGAGDPPSRKASADKGTKLQANKHRKVQVARTGGRKLFREKAQAVFLEWFAATCNVQWSAEKAGFNYKTVLRHRMNDPVFAEGWDRAMRQGYARLEAKRLETKRQATPIGIEGDWDAPEMDAMDPARMDAILRERGREIGTGVRKQGRRPTVASNAEVKVVLTKRLKAFRARVRAAKNPPRNECRVGLPPAIQVQPGGLDDPTLVAARSADGGGPLHPRAAPGGPPPRAGEDL